MNLLRVTIELEWVDTEARGWEVRAFGPDGTLENSLGYATLAEALAQIGGYTRGTLEAQIEDRLRG